MKNIESPSEILRNPKFQTITHWNKSLFPPEIQAAFLFMEMNDTEPINPDKMGNDLEFQFKRKWKKEIQNALKTNPKTSFKTIAISIIQEMGNDWPDWEVEIMVAWAWKKFSKISVEIKSN